MERITIDRHGRSLSPSTSSKERELYTINYENLQSNKSVSSFARTDRSSSKDNIELSLEVEITKSLKQLINEPEKYDAELLDVTIIQPITNDAKTNILKGSDLGNFLSLMEYKNQEKENEPKPIEGSKLKHILHSIQKPCRQIVTNKTDQFVRKSDMPCRKKKKECLKKNDLISAMKSPTARVKANNTFNCLTGKPSTEFVSVDLMKPLFGEIRESLKNVEARIIEMGDNTYGTKTNKINEKRQRGRSTEETTSDEFVYYKQKNYASDIVDNKNQHVYTAPLTFDKMKAAMTCQRSKNGCDNKETPCLCQHCGMIGLLVESQKQPIVQSKQTFLTDMLKKKKDGKSAGLRSQRDILKPRRVTDLRTGSNCVRNYHNYCMIKELSNKVTYLEKRLMEHEQKSVTKDYFKRIIDKIMTLYYKSVSQKSNRKSNIPATKTIATQCKNEHYKRSEYLNETEFCVNRLTVNKKTDDQTANINDVETPTVLVEVEKNGSDENRIESQEPAMEMNWRWGGDILKPGSDLKTRILSLLEENFDKLKATKLNENPNEVNVSIVPEKIDNEIQTDFDQGDEKSLVNMYPKKSFRHFLDILSAKIYNEHILNLNNNSDGVSIKAQTRNRAAGSSRPRQIRLDNENSNLKMDFFAPLKIPSIIQYDLTTPSFTGQIQSYIPLRKSVCTDKRKSCSKHSFRDSLIPKLKTKNSAKQTRARNAIYYVLNEYNGNAHYDRNNNDTQTRSNEIAKGKKKPVCLQYLNPNASKWKEESNVSIKDLKLQDETTEEAREEREKPIHKKTRLKCKKLFTDNMTLEEKLEFFETMAKSKNLDKEKLWNSIWKQAKNYGKSKQDKITIQIPVDNLKDIERTITELEFTIEDIEALADKKNSLKKTSSSVYTSVETHSSCISLNKLKNMEKLHKEIDKSLAQKMR